MIAIIAAYDQNRVIGKDGGMPWHIPGELKRFRQLTQNNVVIMGRKTFESLGKPLAGRINIIISSSQVFEGENLFTVNSLDNAFSLAKDKWPEKKIYIGGGGNIYRQTIELADVMYITEIEEEFPGDTTFPAFDESLFIKEFNGRYESSPPYNYVTYIRKKDT